MGSFCGAARRTRPAPGECGQICTPSVVHVENVAGFAAARCDGAHRPVERVFRRIPKRKNRRFPFVADARTIRSSRFLPRRWPPEAPGGNRAALPGASDATPRPLAARRDAPQGRIPCSTAFRKNVSKCCHRRDLPTRYDNREGPEKPPRAIRKITTANAVIEVRRFARPIRSSAVAANDSKPLKRLGLSALQE